MVGFLASIPSPSSGALTIGPLSIHAYGLMITIGVIAAVWLLAAAWRSAAGQREDGSCGGLGGHRRCHRARRYHVARIGSVQNDSPNPPIWKVSRIPGGSFRGAASHVGFQETRISPAVGLSARPRPWPSPGHRSLGNCGKGLSQRLTSVG